MNEFRMKAHACSYCQQGSFHDQQAVLCRLVEDFPIKEDMLVHCARGLANSCQFPENAVNLVGCFVCTTNICVPGVIVILGNYQLLVLFLQL